MDTVENKFKKIWSDFTVKDETAYTTQLPLENVTSSENARLLALSFFNSYSGFDTTAYGEGEYDTGLTEQQAFDLWQEEYNKQELLAKSQLIANNVATMSRSAYDAIILYHWATGKLFQSIQGAIEYNLLKPLRSFDYETVANMIVNSTVNKDLCIKIATVLRLADYGKPKDRTWYRSRGVFNMRDINEKATLDTDQLRRARFAYYAETQKFLPFTPEGKQRQIVKDYNDTLIVQNFTFSGTSTFTLAKSVSMSPIEKLTVTINDNIQQHLFDFTVDGTTLTITESMNTGDLIKTTIKI
tara:strand:- start:2431 stop:3327 length:897 start_codon:yes stop_codon:yes gene_type:complete